MGRSQAQEETLRLEAESPQEAELAIKDLREKGYAIMKDGKRYVPPPPTPPKIFWDEEPKAHAQSTESKAKHPSDTEA